MFLQVFSVNTVKSHRNPLCKLPVRAAGCALMVGSCDFIDTVWWLLVLFNNNDLETNFQVSRDQDIYELLSNFVGKSRITFSCLLNTCLKWIIKELDQINTIYIYHLSHFEWYRTELYSSLVCSLWFRDYWFTPLFKKASSENLGKSMENLYIEFHCLLDCFIKRPFTYA